jgi:hypothetical protein
MVLMRVSISVEKIAGLVSSHSSLEFVRSLGDEYLAVSKNVWVVCIGDGSSVLMKGSLCELLPLSVRIRVSVGTANAWFGGAAGHDNDPKVAGMKGLPGLYELVKVVSRGWIEL